MAYSNVRATAPEDLLSPPSRKHLRYTMPTTANTQTHAIHLRLVAIQLFFQATLCQNILRVFRVILPQVDRSTTLSPALPKAMASTHDTKPKIRANTWVAPTRIRDGGAHLSPCAAKDWLNARKHLALYTPVPAVMNQAWRHPSPVVVYCEVEC
jgi:hypothetical protein